MSWKYLPVVNKCATILLTIILGYTFGRFGVFDAQHFVPQMVKFVFYVALPLLIIQGIGVNINFYDDDEVLWLYIGCFFLLRLFTLIISFAVVCFQQKDGAIGQVAILWLGSSWISTVILGSPILDSLFGDHTKGITYGILAGISSFTFQLPLKLIFLECNAVQNRIINENREDSNEEPRENSNPFEGMNTNTSHHIIAAFPSVEIIESNTNQRKRDISNVSAMTQDLSSPPVQIPDELREVLKMVARKMFFNPVLWGIILGLLLSLSTLGSKLKLSDTHTSEWFLKLTSWLGACVSPLSLFAMGVWISSSQTLFFKMSLKAILLVISKLFIVPLIMIGITKVFNLHNIKNDEVGRAAIIISCLPISMASFTLGSQYEIGEESLLSQNIILGTLLLLPTVLLWNIAMDNLGLYTEFN